MHRVPQLSRRRAIIVAVLALAVALLGYAAWVRFNEPRYHGRRVSVWFQEFCKLAGTHGSYTLDGRGRHIRLNDTEVPDPALDALVSMGEPAVEYLGKQVAARNP